VHTVAQVLVGSAAGTLFAFAWHAAVSAFLCPLFPTIERWGVCRALLIRDSSSVPNAMQLEVLATQSALARACKAGEARADVWIVPQYDAVMKHKNKSA
jgi:hypothetical protein